MTRAVFQPNHAVAVATSRRGVNPSLVVQRAKGWTKVREEGVCRMCGRPNTVRILTRHHVVPQSYFRRRPKVAPLRHCDANIVPLCQTCHLAVEKREPHARVELRRLLTTQEVAFAIQIAGREWLDARYPTGQRRPVPPVASSPGAGSSV